MIMYTYADGCANTPPINRADPIKTRRSRVQSTRHVLPSTRRLQDPHRPPRCSALSATEASQDYVTKSLTSSPSTYISSSNKQIVPLLSPMHPVDGLPFAAALEISMPSCTSINPTLPPITDPHLYELRFVLAGSGKLIHHSTGKQGRPPEMVTAGDTILMASGAATCIADSEGETPHAQGAVDLASLVIYIPAGLIQGAEPDTTGLATLLHHHWGPALDAQGLPLPQDMIDTVLKGAKMVAKMSMNNPTSSKDDDGVSLPPIIRERNIAWAAQQWIQWLGGISSYIISKNNQVTNRYTLTSTFKRSLKDLIPFRLPNQTNRLALVFDPLAPNEQDRTPFVFGVEIFEPGHKTKPHIHPTAHEMFVVLAGSGDGFSGRHRFPLRAGDIAVFKPGSLHGIDNVNTGHRMYCLELMLPNEQFAEMVRAGSETGRLGDEDLCVLATIGCGGYASDE